MVSSLAGPSPEGIWVAELKSALRAKKLELRRIHGFASGNATLCTKVSRLKGYVGTLARKGRQAAMLAQNVRDLVSNYRKIWADDDALSKRNMKLAGAVQEKVAQTTAESAWFKALSVELVSLEVTSVASNVESASSRWSDHSVAKGASVVEENASVALLVASRAVAYATKRKAKIIGLELKDSLK